jgi:gliding motility-associated-like protein
VLRKISLILAFLPLVLQAQITAPLSSAIRHTEYPVTVRKDSVYIFCTSSASDLGTLVATSTGGTAPFTFNWTRYDQVAKSYSIPVKTESGIASTAPGLIEGGYCVHIYNGTDYDAYFYAWVNLDKPTANAALNSSACTYLSLDGTQAADNFYYYDPSTGASKLLPNSTTFQWSSNPSSTIPANEIDPFISGKNLPYTDITYTLQVVDKFGCASSSSFLYESFHVKADFTATPTSGEAPLEVVFKNNSIHANKYLWDFGDDSISRMEEPPPHKYYTPGEYTVTLSVESSLFCTDTYTLYSSGNNYSIDVLPSSIDIPNVFSPNGDGINDVFIPERASLMFLTVQIFSKSGQRVYHYEAEGDALSEWTGWDGKINNSNRYAEPGAYFYVLRAKGYDDKEYKGSEYRGVVYLYR